VGLARRPVKLKTFLPGVVTVNGWQLFRLPIECPVGRIPSPRRIENRRIERVDIVDIVAQVLTVALGAVSGICVRDFCHDPSSRIGPRTRQGHVDEIRCQIWQKKPG
jgi:hypothetical protein